MRTLLSKYRKGKITPEEFDLLAEKAEAATDGEIANALEKEWMEEGGQIRTKRPPLWFGIAAGLALLVAVGIGIRMADIAATSERLASHEVRINAGNNDRSMVVLPDGTKVTLNPKSQLRYSATFGQAISAKSNAKERKAMFEQYGKATLFDYSYRYFYADGYGKDYRIMNMDDWNNDELLNMYLTAYLLCLYEQIKIYGSELRIHNLFHVEKPLGIFVGSSVKAVSKENIGHKTKRILEGEPKIWRSR